LIFEAEGPNSPLLLVSTPVPILKLPIARTLPERGLKGNTPDIFHIAFVSPRVTDWETRTLVPLVFRSVLNPLHGARDYDVKIGVH
jgi:hypothetical protein